MTPEQLEILGKTTLRISFFAYLFFLLPQIWHNSKKKTTKNLSLMTHILLLVGYISDCIYGWGFSMPIEYKSVTIVGLISLCVQHFQFFLSSKESNSLKSYFSLSVGLLLYFSFSLYFLTSGVLSREILTAYGFIAFGCWSSFSIPQIIYNFKKNTSEGISLSFILLGIVASTCDVISAWTLNWGIPNKFGSPISLLFKLVLASQKISQACPHKNTSLRSCEQS